MKCRHCLTTVNIKWNVVNLQQDIDSKQTRTTWRVRHGLCPACGRIIVDIGLGSIDSGSVQTIVAMAYPTGLAREPLSAEVPDAFASDYREAVAVFPASSKASAALSRRCLQHIIREKAGIKRRDLAQEIEELLDSQALLTSPHVQ